MSSDVTNNLSRDLYILEDESNPHGSRANTIWPTTVLDQVFDNLSPTRKTLRDIIAELRQEIISGGKGNIVFPVTTVNGQTGDVTITKDTIGLTNVDNTRDVDKPLSDPQRQAIMDILRNYDFEVDLSILYNHLTDSHNPHGVSFEQINKDGAVKDYVLQLIAQHNNIVSENVHRDIREKIRIIRDDVDSISDNVEHRIEQALAILDSHYGDLGSHSALFEKKEDKINKVSSFNSTDSSYKEYPSTRAVVEFVANRMTEFRSELPNVQNWIDDIIVVSTRAEVPAPNIRVFRKAYFIRQGLHDNEEIAICRLNPDGRTYSWDYSSFGSSTRFNPEQFVQNDSGISINTRTIVDIIMNESSIVDSIRNTVNHVIPEAMGNYYTRDEIDGMNHIHDIKIVPGTMDGTLRFYVNGDMSTMSEDVRVTGLQRLAFLEHVTENEIHDQAVQARHISNKAIQARHMGDKAVGANNMKASYGTIFGNFDDRFGNTVKEVTLEYLAELLDPMFKVIIENADLVAMQEDKIIELVNKAFRQTIGWMDPSDPANIRLDGTDLIVEYDGEESPDIYFNEAGELILNSTDSPVDKALERFHFDITPDNNLWMMHT